ncbi:MAG: c-type cytochrome, partial [Opitutales bacterium]|nr:c-type cytochrome [Opitutales bacterium]
MKQNGRSAFLLNGILVISTLLLAAGFGLGQWASDSGDWILFLGRFHPVILHLPIGIFTGFLFVFLINTFSKKEASAVASDMLLGLTALSGALAAAAGFCLASEGGFDAELLWEHKMQGTVFAVAILLATLLRVRGLRAGRDIYGIGSLLALAVAGVFMVLAGHHGGSLTHGTTYLTKYAPDWFPGAAEEAPEVDAEVVLAEESAEAFSIMEIFEANCFKCHGPEKQKGDYRMDDPASLFAGGESGLPAIVPGKPMESFLVELITLPRNHDDAMPPEGKSELTDAEILQVIHWVTEGAILGGEASPAVAVESAEEVEEPAKVVESAVEAATEPAAPKVFLASTDIGSDLDYITQVKPLFETYCIRCHGPKKQKAEVRVDNLDPDMTNGHDGDE